MSETKGKRYRKKLATTLAREGILWGDREISTPRRRKELFDDGKSLCRRKVWAGKDSLARRLSEKRISERIQGGECWKVELIGNRKFENRDV